MSAVLKGQPPLIRPMRPEDLLPVAQLEQLVYEFPWTVGIFRDCMLAGYKTVALESNGEIAGYSIMSVAAGEAHLLNICIAPALREQGEGRRLLEHMLAHALAAGADRVYLEVRPSNVRALRLYREAGFEVIGVRRGYYRAHGGHEDAVVLIRRLGDELAD